MNDPANSYFAYLFTSDKSLYTETFGVFKLDFTPSSLKYVYTTLSMSTGQVFSVNFIVKSSSTDANDFIFAGKTISLSDGKTTKTFPTSTGYVMKAKTSD